MIDLSTYSTYSLARLREELEIAQININYLRQDFNHFGGEYEEDLRNAIAHKQALLAVLRSRRR